MSSPEDYQLFGSYSMVCEGCDTMFETFFDRRYCKHCSDSIAKYLDEPTLKYLSRILYLGGVTKFNSLERACV